MCVGTAWTQWVHVRGSEHKGFRTHKDHILEVHEEGVGDSCTLSLTAHISNNYYIRSCILFLYHINGYIIGNCP